VPGIDVPDTPYRRKLRITRAALIKCIFEVEPLKCPQCGGAMKIVAFIEQPLLIERSCDTASYGKKISGRHLAASRPSTCLPD
jgi:hypothetical protein